MPSTILIVDGYEVLATFAEDKNTEAIRRVKQILLSSFAARGVRSKGILVVPPEQRYNIGGGSPDVP